LVFREIQLITNDTISSDTEYFRAQAQFILVPMSFTTKYITRLCSRNFRFKFEIIFNRITFKFEKISS
jgi:hypothetical protein